MENGMVVSPSSYFLSSPQILRIPAGTTLACTGALVAPMAPCMAAVVTGAMPGRTVRSVSVPAQWPTVLSHVHLGESTEAS